MGEANQRYSPSQLIQRWHAVERPLPVRTIRMPARRVQAYPHELPPWWRTGTPTAPFDFTGHMTRLVTDIVARCPEFRRLDPARILVGTLQARNGRPHGLQARVTPLRFRHGELTCVRRGRTFQVQRYFLGDQEFLYLMMFCLPRYLDQTFDEKLITLFHELYHLDPTGNGDLRRHEGRYSLHTRSQSDYDRHMGELARAYLHGQPDPDLHAFLRASFSQLCLRHGAVQGLRVQKPKIFLVPGLNGSQG